MNGYKMINNKQGGCSAKTASKLLDFFGFKLIECDKDLDEKVSKID